MCVLLLNQMHVGLQFCGLFSSIEKAKETLKAEYPNMIWEEALIPGYTQSGFVAHHVNYLIRPATVDEYVAPYFMTEQY